MKLYSTNRQSPTVGLREAVMTGLAPDGGLYMPERIPVIPAAFFNNISGMSVRDIAFVVADLMLGDEIDSAEIRQIVNDTFTFDIPLVKVEDNIYSLELFHGPTYAFKDVGARFLARIIGHYSSRQGSGKVKVLVATSGDSGGAVAAGFNRAESSRVVILVNLFPRPLQKLCTLLYYVVTFAFFAFMVYYGIQLTMQKFALREMATAVAIPMGFIMICVPLCGVLGMIGTLQSLLEYPHKVEIGGEKK